MNRRLKVILPIIVVALAAVGAWALIQARKAPETVERVARPPLVRVQDVKLADLQLTVTSQGTVRPRTASVLVPEVSGRVIEVSPAFTPGGFFEAGELLLRIDPHDYRQAIVQARARVAQAELLLAREQGEADVARSEWEALGDGDDASPLTMHLPQLADAQATVAAARAAVEQAERDLERTEIRAPYAGRVQEKQVDFGQFVNRGQSLATIYAVDYAEISLPLPDDQLAFIDLPLDYRDQAARTAGPEVILRADFAGRVHEWRGRIVRTEGVIDPQSRMVRAVARVKDPYGRGSDPDRPPLAAGLFVQAEIVGRTASGVAVLPRSALRDDDVVLVVDDQDRLRFRQVEILRSTEDSVIVASGLAAGERVCTSPLVAVTDGMRVRTSADETAGTASEETS
jgi:RND family efflux transporter MFP subunit